MGCTPVSESSTLSASLTLVLACGLVSVRTAARLFSVAPRMPAPGEPVTAEIALDIPAGAREKLAVWVEVTDPDGNSPLWGRQVVLLEGGRGKVQFPTPYNPLPGRWRVKVTELFSGRSAEAGWVLR